MRYIVRQFDGAVPLLSMDVRTGNATVAAECLREVAVERGDWDDVMIRIQGERPLRGEAAKMWASVVLDA